MHVTTSILSLIVVLNAAGVAPAADAVLHTNIERTDANLFLPRGIKTIRAVLINPADKNVGPGIVWSEACRHWGMAHMGLMLENVDKRNNRPNTLKKVIAAALEEFAAKTSHPELVHVPYAFGGMSKGGGWSAELGQFYAERTIAFNNVCGWVGKPDRDLSMPAVIVIGGVPDGFKMLDAITTQYEPARKGGAPWCLALQWGNAHDYGNSNALAVPFLDAAIAARWPQDTPAAERPVELKPMRLEDGWLGDRSTWETHYATIAKYADYRGDKAAASWLPDRYVAYTWRSFVSPSPPVQLAAQTADGAARLPDFAPTTKRALLVKPDVKLKLSAVLAPGAEVASLNYCDGDVLLGTVTPANPEYLWPKIPAGPHAIYIEYTLTGGEKGVSNPALILGLDDISRSNDNKK